MSARSYPRIYLLISSVLIGFASGTAPTHSQEMKPSRPAEKGCKWRPFESQPLGVQMLVQDCVDANQHYIFSTSGSWIEQHRPSDDVTFGGPRVVRVFTKKANQSLEGAINAAIISRMKSPQKESCKVRPIVTPKPTPQRILMEIAPTGAYEKKIMKELQEGPRDFGCGPFGKGQGISYFEYHPAENRRKFLYVVLGMDAPLFDENSIRLLPKR